MDFRRVVLFVCLFGILLAINPRVNAAQSVAIAWDPSASPDVVGYRVALGTSPGTYTQSIDVGAVTTATVSGLTDGLTYYLAVTAYNSTYGESGPSNEVSYTAPGIPPAPTPTPTPT